MFTPEFVQVLLQIPIVAIFIWFVLEWSKRNQESLDRRDAQMQEFLHEQRVEDRKVLASLVERIENLSANLNNHDRKTDAAITTMTERTRPRSTPKE